MLLKPQCFFKTPFIILSYLKQLTITTSFAGDRCNGVEVTIDRFMHFLLRGPLSRLLGADFAKRKTFSLQAYEDNNLFNKTEVKSLH